MMTVEQWTEIVDWISDRFPNKPWAAEQAIAFYHDLEDHDASDVWAALYGFYEEGQAFAPNGSQLLARANEERRTSARDEMYRQPLPAPARPAPLMTDVGSYAERRFGEHMTYMQLVERIHVDKGPCNTMTCDTCHDVTV